MLKVLYISHCYENSGWGDASRNYLEALNTIPDVEVVSRPVIIHGGAKLSDNIKEMEARNSFNCDICIQHVLPHYFCASSKFKKNIGLFVTETSTIKYNQWSVYIQQMDELWIPNNYMKASLIKDNLFDCNKIKVIPHASNINKFTFNHPSPKIREIEGTFKFYFIGEFNRRKNLVALLEAFHTGFDYSEPVSLIIKTNISGLHPQQSKQVVTEMCSKVKKGLRLYSKHESYKQEAIITDRLTDEQMCGLHQYCDCLVSPSFGEAWNIPAFDAMGFGKTPICINSGGHTEFIKADDSDCGKLLSCEPEIVCGVDGVFPDMFTGRERWMNVNRDDLIASMRYYYERKGKISQTSGLNQAEKFSYTNIGKMMKEQLI